MPNAATQVKFFKGNYQTYSTSPGNFVDGIFFDEANHEIYLNNIKYSNRVWSYLEDASVAIVDSTPYLRLDFTTYLNDTPTSIKLPRYYGEDAIGISVNTADGDSSVFLKIDDTGNSETWLTQSANGLKFDESILTNTKINNKGILTSPWLTGDDVSLGSIPVPLNTTLETTDTVAMAFQKLKLYAEELKIYAIKKIDVNDASDTTKFTVNDSSIHNTITIKEGSYIQIDQPTGIEDKIIISSTLKAGENITITADGSINAEGGTFWNEID